jgi:anthranilate phosphoribosyltransferase
MNQLAGGSPEENKDVLLNILGGDHGPERDIVLLNSAYALDVSGKFASLEECVVAAKESIDSGAALKVLSRLVDSSKVADKIR